MGWRPWASLAIGVSMLGLSATPAKASPVTWYWQTSVNGYQCISGPCTNPQALSLAIPLGALITISMTLDPTAPAINPANCLQTFAQTTLTIGNQSVTKQFAIWDQGFAQAGFCGSGEVEVGGFWDLPTIPTGWTMFDPGNGNNALQFWWLGLFSSTQPSTLFWNLPSFNNTTTGTREAFTITGGRGLGAVVLPEPVSGALLAVGLAALAIVRMKRGVARTRRGQD